MGMVKKVYYDSLYQGRRSRSSSPAAKASMIPASFIPQVKTWRFGPAQGDGDVKSYPLTVGGMDIVINLQGCLSPFSPSSLRDSTRKTLTLRLPQVWDTCFGEMETALIQEVSAGSTKFFDQKLAEEQVLERYKYLSKKTEEYPRNVRVKLNTSGFYACRYWDGSRARIEAPVDHSGLNFNTVLRIRALWVSAEAWGLVCDCTDLQLLENTQVECPF